MKKTNYLFLILGLLAIPSSLIGINEFTNYFNSDFTIFDTCKTGVKDNYFKNCEYKFQFDLPTHSWSIYDVNDDRILSAPYSMSSNDYWVSMDYLYGANNTSDAYGAVIIFDIRDTSFITFEDYNGAYYKLMLNDTFNHLEYFSENGKFEFVYEMDSNGKLFSCYEIHQKRIFVVYLIRTCQHPEGLDADQIKTDIALFLRSFRFF